MSLQLIRFLENNSLSILRDAMPDVRAQGGEELSGVSDDTLQVAMYTVLLKVIDAMRENAAVPQGVAESRGVREFFLQQVKEMMAFIDGQSSYTVGHTPAVVRYVGQIASRMGLPDTEVDDLEYAAWLHNIGLLNERRQFDDQPRRLSDDEIKAARNHTVIGAEMIRPLGFVSHLVPIVRYHHHRFDGRAGTPKGETIPLGARIIAIADAYKAMCEPRAYRPALTRKEALLEIVKESGGQFDPQLVPFVHELS